MDYHQDRFDDYSLLIYDRDDLKAVMPCNINGGIVHSHQGLSYGGIVLSKTIRFNEVLEVYKTILQYLHENEISKLILKQTPTIYHQLPSQELDYLIHQTNGRMVRCDIAAVVRNENALPIESSNRIRGLKRALQNDLEVKEVTELADFWETILVPNLALRHEAKPTHSAQEIQLLKNRFPENIRQFNVYHNSTLVGGATIFVTDEVAHVQYISANEDRQALGSLDLLFDELMKRFKSKTYFDFGISNEEAGTKVNAGLLKWKEDFGARAIAHRFFEIETKNYVQLENILR